MNLKYIIGRIVCWRKNHHVDGHKFRLNAELQLRHLIHGYGYRCSRCGRVRAAPMPVRRVKK